MLRGPLDTQAGWRACSQLQLHDLTKTSLTGCWSVVDQRITSRVERIIRCEDLLLYGKNRADDCHRMLQCRCQYNKKGGLGGFPALLYYYLKVSPNTITNPKNCYKYSTNNLKARQTCVLRNQECP